ncbi:MAG: V-type ATPase subunit [Candidatus Edwardsbacteria bacterium]|nr:V-type ATPase subunit [Candidatus Edwardsbacteria bacterium]MBU1576654.1 V-type ATPase subunit [Candidatus Edwardsbacteria bacterium]MBU2594482.1 V-type ATPase subunit [Candidatus Edwardsbacteria bacterium]
MPSDYGYINARLKGQHSRLLKPGAYEELLGLSGFDAFAKWLAGSSYSKEWQEAQTRFAGLAAAEEALSANFNSSTRLMRKISDGSPGKLIGLILRRWDLENVKAVIRGIHHRWETDEIFRAVLPAGNLDKIKLMELCRKSDLRELADTLATWGEELAVPLTRAMPEYQKEHKLAGLELALDQFYYGQSLKGLTGLGYNKSLVRDFLRREIDLLNAKALRRLMAREKIDLPEAAGYYLPGGKLLTREKYAALLDPKESKRALRSVRGTPLYRLLTADDSQGGREEKRDKEEWRRKALAYRGDPLGIDVALGFLWQKYFEVVNLKLIARGKHFGLPAEDIRYQLLTA